MSQDAEFKYALQAVQKQQLGFDQRMPAMGMPMENGVPKINTKERQSPRALICVCAFHIGVKCSLALALFNFLRQEDKFGDC